MLGFMKVQQPGSPIHNTLTMSQEVTSINSNIPPKKPIPLFLIVCVHCACMYVSTVL